MRVIVFGLNVSVTGTLFSKGFPKIDGLATDTPSDVELVANTNGELPIAKSTATEKMGTDLARIVFMARLEIVETNISVSNRLQEFRNPICI